jgi:uncharacterized membrane protein
MTQTNDALVDEYLAHVARATAGLPPERRDELIRDLREHIDTERAELTDDSEAGVRAILERLGDPDMIAREAADGEPVLTLAPPVRKNRTALWIVLAVVAVLVVLVLCVGTALVGHSTQSA